MKPQSPNQSLKLTKLAALLPLAAALALVFGAPAQAQYFGRTPVQWERFDFKVLKTEHFDIYYYDEGKEAAEMVGRLGERWLVRLEKVLRHKLSGRQPVVLYASSPQFQQTNTIGGAPGEGTGGVTEAFKRRIVLPVGGSIAETDHVFGHELVHAFQYDLTGQGKSRTNMPSALDMPLWFIEGMAEYLSVGPVDPHTSMWIRDAVRKEKLPRVKDLSNPNYFPYRWGQALWSYIAGRYGDAAVADMMRAVGPRSNDPEELIKEKLGISEEQLSKDWHAAVRAATTVAATGRKLPGDYGAALVTEKDQGGDLNVAPALSPDGSKLAFLSERDLFSVDLFLADANSGRVMRALSRTAKDPHLESIQFIQSSGSFDPSGERVALGAVSKGRPLLVIVDTKNGKRVQEVPFPKPLGEIMTPAFAPDGTRVAFSALVNGFTDLFVYDLNAHTLKRLTEDKYADLQPSWSKDGRTIAFVTDRFSTDLPTIATGNYRLAAADASGGGVRPLPSFMGGKNINPQWGPDGVSLYFLSDALGATNVFRLDTSAGKIFQVTDLLTGASGITALSPALTVAQNANKLAFTAYDQSKYEIYSVTDVEKLKGWELSRTVAIAGVENVPDPKAPESRADGVIPGAKETGAVLAASKDPNTGLVSGKDFTREEYKTKLKLDYLGQPYVGAGVDRYGTAFAGGISASFSDMLGEHTLDTMFQANSVAGFRDIGAAVSYVNRKRRLNWGAQVAQVPYVSGYFSPGVAVVDGRQVYAENTLLYRELERQVGAIAFYPFNSSFRIEGQAGFRNITFDQRIESDYFDFRTGQYLGRERQDLDAADSLTFGEASIALVRDTSVFGATAPLMGQRFRFEATPTFGTLNFTGVLADFRHYFNASPVTLAVRAMHYGRYGAGGTDARLYPVYIGYQSLLRGYDVNNFTAEDCGASLDGSCPAYDRLIGSKMAVGNVEVRAPLLALFGAKNLYGPLPIDIGAFFDAGVAWDNTTKPKFLGGDRALSRSVGAVARMNLFGFAVLELDYVKPLDRASKKAHFQFNISGGF